MQGDGAVKVVLSGPRGAGAGMASEDNQLREDMARATRLLSALPCLTVTSRWPVRQHCGTITPCLKRAQDSTAKCLECLRGNDATVTTIYVVGTLVTPGQYDDFLNTTFEMRIELCAELTLIYVFFFFFF